MCENRSLEAASGESSSTRDSGGQEVFCSASGEASASFAGQFAAIFALFEGFAFTGFVAAILFFFFGVALAGFAGIFRFFFAGFFGITAEFFAIFFCGAFFFIARFAGRLSGFSADFQILSMFFTEFDLFTEGNEKFCCGFLALGVGGTLGGGFFEDGGTDAGVGLLEATEEEEEGEGKPRESHLLLRGAGGWFDSCNPEKIDARLFQVPIRRGCLLLILQGADFLSFCAILFLIYKYSILRVR